MIERNSASVTLREVERREIEAQIKAFLDKGGRIEQVPLTASSHKPVGKAGVTGFSAAVDGF